MANLLKIAGYTLRDKARSPGMVVLLGLVVLFVLAMRGCYDGRVMIDGRPLEGAAVVGVVSRLVFHLVSSGMLLMAAMLAMTVFSRDRHDGSAVMFLSRPVERREYVLGRIVGTWLLALGSMFVLHAALLATVWFQTGRFAPSYLTASLIGSVNLLFVIACTSLLSLLVPGVVAALVTLGIVFVGFVSDGGHQLFSAAVLPLDGSGPALWRLLYPKVFMVQAWADTLLDGGAWYRMGPVHPLVNLAGYIVALLAAAVAVFGRKEL